jgi:hypothetical protein
VTLEPQPTKNMTERTIVAKMATTYTREQDDERPVDLVLEIRRSLGCSWGRALCLANDVRLLWPVGSDRA